MNKNLRPAAAAAVAYEPVQKHSHPPYTGLTYNVFLRYRRTYCKLRFWMKEPASQCKCYSLHVPCMLIIGRCCWWEKCLKSQTKSHVCWLFFMLTTKESSKLGINGSPCSEATIRWILHSVPVMPSLMQCLNIINSLSQCKQTSITNIIFNLVNEFPPIDEALSWAAILNPALNKINIQPQGQGFHCHSY